MTPGIEIHIPASPTRAFANMLFFLVHSLADRAGFETPWQVVVTLGRDVDFDPEGADFGWARGHPVVFRQASAQVWAECAAEARRLKFRAYVHCATILEQFSHDFTAPTVIFMDADTVVTGSLAPVVAQVQAAGAMAAKPAWQPPPVDIDAVLAHAGLGHAPRVMPYSGYGWSFVEPRFGPPYYNGGFIVCPNRIAQQFRASLNDDFAFVARHYMSHYVWQIAQCMTMVRHGVPVIDLDERYNMGIGPAAPSILEGPEGTALETLGEEQVRDRRLIHYCTPAPTFVRNATMADDGLLDAFLRAEGLTEGEAMLQAAFAPHAEAWRAVSARR